jgi:CYTH domain-containing protein
MAENLEIEKKYLVEFPKSWNDLAKLFDNLVDVKRISQTYLKSKKGEPSPRVRKTIQGLTGDTDTVYHFNKKEFVESGVHKETEFEISKKEFLSFLKDAHPEKSTVEKTRFIFKYNDQTFELDVFKGALIGLAILEIELKNKNDTVELPPFLKIIKDVTNDKKYNNFNLANKELHD